MAAPGHRLSVRMGARLTCFPEPSPPGDQSQHHTGEAGGRVATALSQHPEPQTLDSPKINMGMKYPAGMGIVVARISIQNCGENGAGLWVHNHHCSPSDDSIILLLPKAPEWLCGYPLLS